MSTFRSSLCVSILFSICFVAGCSTQTAQVQPPPDTRQADETTIRNTSIEWNNVTKAKDIDKFVAYYADDAVRMKNNSPSITGKAAIRADWQEVFALPGPGLAFKTTSVNVSKSGDIAVEYGIYDLVTTDKKNKENDEKGKYIVVWGKQSDGSWKAIADIENYGH